MTVRNERQLDKEGKTPAWLSRELLVKLQEKKQQHRQCKQRQVTCKEYRDEVCFCRDGVRKAKAKAKLELSLARDTKNNKKGFYMYVNQERKAQKCVPTQVNSAGKRVTIAEEKLICSTAVLQNHRITEWVRLEGTHSGSSGPTCSTRVTLEHMAQGCVQAVLEYLH